MSYILDALKKSEQERGHGAVPGVQTVHSSSLNYHQEKRTLWPWFLGAIVAINLIAVVYYIQTRDAREFTASPQEEVVSKTTSPLNKKENLNSATITTTPRPVQQETTVLETEVAEQTKTFEPIFETIDLYDLPLSVKQYIPELEFSAHVYSSNPLQRSIVINGRFMEEGTQINNELTLREITSDGAIFDFRGYRFSTSVLSGWN